MRKQIIFQQNSANTCLANIKNIFGFSINYVQDKIKKHQGVWSKKSKKFQIPLSKVPSLSKQLQSIDKLFYIEQIPHIVTQMCSKYRSNQGGNKIRKQIVVDGTLVRRYKFIQQQILKNIVDKTQGNQSLNYQKVLVICPEDKAGNWLQQIQIRRINRLRFDNGQTDRCLRDHCFWLCSYEELWKKCQQLYKYCFQTIIIDQAEILATKISNNQQCALEFIKFLANRHFVFPITTKLWLNKLQFLTPLLSILLPQTNLKWLANRYNRKENFSQLNFLINTCNLARDVNNANNQNKGHQHYFNKVVLPISQPCTQKIKSIQKKIPQSDQKKLLQNPSKAKNSQQKKFIAQMCQIMNQQKFQKICSKIHYLALDLNLKLAIIIQDNSIYRSIQNFLCEKQIAYCHYEHHLEVVEFNKNPTKMAILVKMEYLLCLDFTNPLSNKDSQTVAKLAVFEPQQYLCLTGLRNIMFPDVDWMGKNKQKQQKIRQLVRYANGDITRHYWVLKNTYEQKWIKNMQEEVIVEILKLDIQEDIGQEEQEQALGNDQEQGVDPTFAYCELNLAKVQEEYGQAKIIQGVSDIDQQFDRLEFQALQEKQRKQMKRKIKSEKMGQSQLQNQFNSQLENSNKKQISKQINTNRNPKEAQKNNKQADIVDSDQQYQIFLKKRQPEPRKMPNQIPIFQLSDPNPNEIPILEKIDDPESKSRQQIQVSKLGKIQQFFLRDHEDNDLEGQGNREEQRKRRKQAFIQDSGFVDDDLLEIGKMEKQDQTQQVKIIQVRKPKINIKPRQRAIKSKFNTLKVILHPSPNQKLEQKFRSIKPRYT